jgi:hypothetical protein
MRTFSTELEPFLDQPSATPRIYADANVPAGVVQFMRERLQWDVFFVLEEDDLRRAPDAEHFRLARRLHRTLVTLDRDYLDDRRFPPGETDGVLVVSAPDERALTKLLRRVASSLFAIVGEGPDRTVMPLPLRGRKLHAQVDWPGPIDPGDRPR